MKLPPYAKPLALARARGMVPRLLGLGHVVVVLDWSEPSACHPRIVIPPDTDPTDYDLGFLAGLHITVNHAAHQAERVVAVVEALLAAGVSIVDTVNRQDLRTWARFEGANHAP